MWATVGVRSLIRREGTASRVSRRHLLVDHGDDGVHGLFTVAGGKLTAWRSIAAEVVDDVLQRRDRGATDARRGIGPPVRALSPDADATTERLWRLYGQRAGEVTARVDSDPWWGAKLTPESPAIRAEVAHAVEREWAKTLADIVVRRLALGFGRDLGRRAAEAVAEIAVDRLGWDRARVDRELREFDAENDERRLPDRDGSSQAIVEPRAGRSEHSSWREPVGLGAGLTTR